MIIFYVLKWEDSIAVVKPVIVPAIYYYYFQTKNRPINILFTIALWLFFVADMIEIIDSLRGIYLIMICGLLSYLIMFRFGIKDHIKLVYTTTSVVFTGVVAISLAILCAYVIMNMGPMNTIYFAFFIVYATAIISMLSYAILRIFSNNDYVSRLFLAMVGVMFLSDLLYAFNRYVEFYLTIGIVSFVAQFISYYWMVEYFNRRSTVFSKGEVS